MSKSINLTLIKISYQGDSIGREIKIIINAFDKSFSLDKTIKSGDIKKIAQSLGKFEIEEKLLESDITITIMEKDIIFSDSATVKTPINIDPNVSETQFFSSTIKVGENRSWWKKLFWGNRQATFDLQFSIEVKPAVSNIQKYIYTGVNREENYNHYDDLIFEVVNYWNNEFSKDTDPPKELLDPSLVKAIMYQESRVGYDKTAGNDVMQVGHPSDPAIKTLRGELKEYWIHQDEQILLKYDAQVNNVKDSVMWGVRWLYHKAQGITEDNRRYWRTWKEAVYGYGPSTKEYEESVWNIYKNGIKKEKNATIQLWSIIGILAVLTFSFFGQINADELRASISDSFEVRDTEEIQGLEIINSSSNPNLFATVIERKKDWWEDLKIGKWKNGKVDWLILKDAPTEQSILSFRLLGLQGLSDPLLEVYGKTHMGNGNLYIYKINDDIANLIFTTMAVDNYYDSVWKEKNFQKYGYYTCGETYKDGRLDTQYEVRDESTIHITLSGYLNVDCEQLDQQDNGYMHSTMVRVEEIPVIQNFIINN